MSHEASLLSKIFEDAGVGWIASSDPTTILSEIHAVEAELEHRYGTRPSLLKACHANPTAMASFLQSFAVPMTCTMRTMIVQLLDGATIEEVRYRYKRGQNCTLTVQLSHPSRDFGESDRFESSTAWDVEVFRHFAMMMIDDEPLLDGYYAFLPESHQELPWEVQARAALLHTLDATTWDVEGRQVEVSGNVFPDVEAFRQYLQDVYSTAWYARVPFESGVAVFEPPAVESVDQALQPYAEKIASLGWRPPIP